MKLGKKQLVIITTMIMLLASYVLPYTSRASAAGEYLTVAEALATSTGTTVNVKGYIVGYTKGTNSFTFTAPFGGDTNLAIADSPTETDPAKIMPVEVTKDFRPTFGLLTNPANDGKEIFITATTAAYFSMPGLKTPTSIAFTGEGAPTDPPPVEPPPVGSGDGLKISTIQGTAHTSPYVGKTVQSVEGIVTYVVDASNFYMQSAVPDDNPATSEGILVNRSSHGLSAGDQVAMDGTVKEVNLDGYSDRSSTDLTMTEIAAATIAKKASGVALPSPVVIDRNTIPSQVIDNDQFATFDPSEDGIDYYESIEGMRVSLEKPTVVGPQKNGEVPVIVGQADGKTYTNAGGTILTKDTSNPERLQLLIGDRNYVTKTGDSFDGTVTGVVSYSYSNYKILIKNGSLPALRQGPNVRETLQLEKETDKLTIASYNIENFSAADTAKTNKLAESFVTNLKTPDIIGLVEVQDNNGETNNGVVDASANYSALINAIKSSGGPTYNWTDIAPENNKDGGAPGGNIRVGFLYNPERVTLNTSAPKGTATQAVGYENGSLTLNPGRIDPTNSAFSSSRKPLAAEFTFNGEKLIVIANHFNSKGGDEALFGKHQPPVLGSEAQRIKIAQVVNSFVADVLNKNAKANVVLLGDLNDFEFSNPLTALKGEILDDLAETVPVARRYSYNFQGNAQVLDHILATKELAAGAETDFVHMNSQFMEAHGRVSDHDPIVAQFDFSVEKEPGDETDPVVVPPTGWVETDGVWYYYDENGEKHTGWLELEGKKYYLGQDGVMQIGWVTIEGANYYFGTNGAMLTGWVKSGANWYYLGQDGIMQTGLIEVNGKTYFLGPDGAMKTGWVEIDGFYHYFFANGEMVTGWAEIGEETYFFDDDGVMLIGMFYIDEDVYYFDEDGILQTGWSEFDGERFYFDPETAAMVTGWEKVDGQWYFFDEYGVMQKKWVRDGVKWYYLNESNGAMKTGWVKDQNKWYFMSSSGAMQVGWVKSNNKWYYMDPTKGMMKTGWVSVNGKWYYLNTSSGAMQTGWFKEGGKWYYLNTSSGAMQTGWLFISGKWYYFYKDGKMAASTKIQGYKLGADGAMIR
ncbi:DUF6359 domain-containing protein [Neobacillus rhizosphaerae]|uniref:DUF6359 domain-containing protein n=1 Tax=Neobacillus rhizosphaerae TaxID=2880965 RepID=UPI003D296F99